MVRIFIVNGDTKKYSRMLPTCNSIAYTICVCEVVNRIVFFLLYCSALFTWHEMPMGVNEKVVKTFTNNPPFHHCSLIEGSDEEFMLIFNMQIN